MSGGKSRRQALLARRLKEEAGRLGFEACGIAEARQLDEEARRLEAWLLRGRHASMGYMSAHFDKRIDPRKLVPGARSIISVLCSYWQPQTAAAGADIGRISRYAWGDDYHQVLKERLYALYHWLETEIGQISGRAFVDSAPVMDKAWAQRSGLGWIGKHTNLISRQLGSWFFIGELIVDVPLEADHPVEDHCGSCTRCIDACPTDAIYRPYAVDSNRCISYWTIEHRGDTIPDGIAGDLEGWIFGCDICQEVCPWNKFKKPTREDRFLPRPGVTDTPLDHWEEMDLKEFCRRFKGSAVRRAKFDGFKRNVRAALQDA